MNKLTYEEVALTPEVATDWLENWNYGDNRRINKNRVALYASQIKAGRWRLNGETIIFDKRGFMLNGQHRCAAVIEAGKAITVAVLRGAEQSTYTTMDQCSIRTGAIVMGSAGFSNTSERAAICRAMFCWEITNGKSAIGTRKIMPDELLLVQDCYGEEVDEAVLFVLNCKRDVPVSCGLLGLAHILFKRARPRKSGEFLDVLSTGVTPDASHPAFVFRKRVIRDKLRDRSLPNSAIWSMLIRAWNAFEKGESLKSLLAKRNPDGDWVTNPIRGLGKVAGKLK